LAQQVGRRAAQHEKSRRPTRPIGQHSQHRKQVGPPLHLVNDHQSAQSFERKHRVAEPRQFFRVLQIEVRACPLPLLHEPPGQRRLSDLPRADNSHDWMPPQQSPQNRVLAIAPNHGPTLP
jgi:hypothetical protein